MANTLSEILEQLSSVKFSVLVDIQTSDFKGISHSKKLEITLKEAGKPEEKPPQVEREDISKEDDPVGHLADQIERAYSL